MKIVSPDPIAVSQLDSTNVPLEAIPAWTAGSYNAGDQVINNTIIWEALKTTTLEPLGTEYPGINTEDWLWVGYVNQWRMFRDGRDSKTTNTDLIDVTITPSVLPTTVVLFGLQGLEARLTVTDGVTTYYSITESLKEPEAATFFELFTVPASQKETLVIDELIPYPDTTYQVEIEATAGATAACGRLVIGNDRDIGVTNYDTRVSSLSATVARRDEFLNLTLLKRRSIRTVDYNVTVPSNRVEFAQRQLEAVDGTVTVFIGEGSFGSTVTLGIVRDFQINIAGPNISDATIRTEDF